MMRLWQFGLPVQIYLFIYLAIYFTDIYAGTRSEWHPVFPLYQDVVTVNLVGCLSQHTPKYK